MLRNTKIIIIIIRLVEVVKDDMSTKELTKNDIKQYIYIYVCMYDMYVCMYIYIQKLKHNIYCCYPSYKIH